MFLNFKFCLCILETQNQNYVNYVQRQKPQGRFISSLEQNSRNGFFPIDHKIPTHQSSQSRSYHSQDLYLGGTTSPPFFQFHQFAVSKSHVLISFLTMFLIIVPKMKITYCQCTVTDCYLNFEIYSACMIVLKIFDT